jgi:hypothetical protein
MSGKLKAASPAKGAKTARRGMEMHSFYAWDGEILVLNVLGTPNAGKDAIGKVKGKQLCISVTATPVAGKATDHMVRFLAEKFGVAAHDIEVVFGRFNINKRFALNLRKCCLLSSTSIYPDILTACVHPVKTCSECQTLPFVAEK